MKIKKQLSKKRITLPTKFVNFKWRLGQKLTTLVDSSGLQIKLDSFTNHNIDVLRSYVSEDSNGSLATEIRTLLSLVNKHKKGEKYAIIRYSSQQKNIEAANTALDNEEIFEPLRISCSDRDDILFSVNSLDAVCERINGRSIITMEEFIKELKETRNKIEIERDASVKLKDVNEKFTKEKRSSRKSKKKAIHKDSQRKSFEQNMIDIQTEIDTLNKKLGQIDEFIKQFGNIIIEQTDGRSVTVNKAYEAWSPSQIQQP